MARKPFAKADFDPNLVDNYEDGFTGDKERKVDRPQRYSFQRVLIGLAISIRPRSTHELMRIAGIKYRTNAIRTIKALGGIQTEREGKTSYWGAPYMLMDPIPAELVEKYDDWLFGRGDWPEEFQKQESESVENEEAQ
jgi:hypothetical protein